MAAEVYRQAPSSREAAGDAVPAAAVETSGVGEDQSRVASRPFPDGQIDIARGEEV